MKIERLLWGAVFWEKDDGAGGGGDDDQGDQDDGADDDKGKGDDQPLTAEVVAAMIATETKGLKSELAKRDKKISDLNNDLKNQGLSAEEKLAEQQRQIDERERAVGKSEVKLSATKALAAAGLDVGWADLVQFPDEDSIASVVGTIQKSMADDITKQVTEKLKAAGIKPNAGGGGKPDPTDQTVNPFTKDHWNLTEQMAITKRDPQLAAKLKKAAGG